MRIILAGMGALQKKDPLDLAALDYAERLGHYVRFELKVSDAAARKSAPDVVVRQAEAEILQRQVPKGAWVVTLDEHGKLYDTAALSRRLQGWLNGGRDVVLLQGGATGLDESLKKAAQESWSLSPLTLPHRLARVVALEALYRGMTVLRGEPYHRA